MKTLRGSISLDKELTGQYRRLFRNLGLLMLIVIALVTAALGIANTMMMSITERRREIGVLASLGADPGLIRRLFLVESATIGAVGAVVGILCGGNIDVNMISRIIERGLVGDGRMAHLIVKVRDRPGSLSLLTDLVAEMGANVLDIHHRRGFADISVGDVEIVLQIETRGRAHVAEIIRALEDRGVTVEVDT